MSKRILVTIYWTAAIASAAVGIMSLGEGGAWPLIASSAWVAAAMEGGR